MKHTGRKGWQASVKDTWSLDEALSPIIAAGLRKFLEQEDKLGIPGLLYDESADDQLQADEWVRIVKAMLYAFEEGNRPDMEDYDFDYVMDLETGPPGGFTLEHTNEEVYQQYRADERTYEALRQEGLDYFAKYFKCLWW